MLMQTVKMGGFAAHRVGYQSLFTPPAWSPSWSPVQKEAFQTKPELGQAVPNVTTNFNSTKRALLASAAQKIIDTGNAVCNALNGVYRQYSNRANPGFWKSIAANSLAVFGQDINRWLGASSDAQAVLKLRSAAKLGSEWVNQVKNEWYGDKPSVEINLSEEAVATDVSIDDQVGAAFDNVVECWSKVVTIAGQIETLPANLIQQGVKVFWGSLGDRVGAIGKDVAGFGQGILDLLHAAGQVTQAAGSGAKEATSGVWAPVIGVGVVVLALYLLLK